MKLTKICNYLDEKIIKDGPSSSCFSWLSFYKSQNTDTRFIYAFYRPSLCVVLRGEKSIEFGDKIYTYDKNRYLIAPTHISAKVGVSKAPYLSLRIDFSIEEILKEFPNPNKSKDDKDGLFFGVFSDELIDSISRLLFLHDNESFRAGLIKKEILYLLLNSESRDFLCSYVENGTASNTIIKAIDEIKTNFNTRINMDELAKDLGMSPSSFYSNFKRITKLTPLNFLKRLRLEEAKNILLNSNTDTHSAAIAVGYESPTQFSREYSRMFGLPPITHIKSLRSKF